MVMLMAPAQSAGQGAYLTRAVGGEIQSWRKQILPQMFQAEFSFPVRVAG